MPVSPPYSIIDTIAKLRASGGEAWGQAAANVGKDVGNIGQAVGDKALSDAKQQHQVLHDSTLTFDSKYDGIRHVAPTAGTDPTPGSQLRTNAQPQPGILGGATEPAPNMSVNQVPQRSVPQPGAPMPNVPPLTGQSSQPPAGPSAFNPGTPAQGDPTGSVSLADHMRSEGVPEKWIPKTAENIWGQPKMTTREESQARTTQASMKTAGAEEAKMNETHTKLTQEQADALNEKTGTKAYAVGQMTPNDQIKTILNPAPKVAADSKKTAADQKTADSDKKAAAKKAADALKAEQTKTQKALDAKHKLQQTNLATKHAWQKANPLIGKVPGVMPDFGDTGESDDAPEKSHDDLKKDIYGS